MQEYWDLVDYKGNSLHRKMLRGSAQPPNTWHVVVGIVIRNSQGKILLIQRASCKEQFPDLWEHIGGCAVAEETAIDAAYREVTEEIGISVLKENLIFLDKFFEKTAYVHTFLLQIDFVIEDCIFQKEEVQDAKWVDPVQYINVREENNLSPAAARRLARVLYKISML